MRLAFPFTVSLLVCLSLNHGNSTYLLFAQEPSAAMRQADADYRAGVAALNKNDLQTAEARFQAVTALVPDQEPGHSALGAVLVREGKVAEGIRELQRALALKPGDSAAQLTLALVYEQSGAAAKSLPLFAKVEATATASKHSLPPTVLASYARALAAAGQTVSATAHMKQAVLLDPRNAELRDDLGSLYAQRQDWDRAEEELSEAIRLRPDFAMAHLHLGYVFQAEQKADAISEWVQAHTMAPGNPAIALAAGKAVADAGHDDKAVPVLEDAHRLEPASNEAAYQLGLVLQRVNRVQEAVALLKAVVEAEPSNAEALINLGLALSQVHQAAQAIPYLQRAIALKPENLTAHQDLAAAYLQVDQVTDAVKELRAALNLAPDSPKVHYDLGVAYKLQDDAADAIPELQAAENLDPSSYEPSYVLGMLYMQGGRYADAATQLEASLKLHSENADAWATLGSVYNKLDRLPEAVRALRQAIQQLPGQADPHLLLASVLMKQNEAAGAAAERKIAADLMRAHMDFQRAEVATNSGKSSLAAGKIDEAIAQFREALTFDPAYIEAHLQLAEALEKQGKPEEAEAERAQARSLAKPAQ